MTCARYEDRVRELTDGHSGLSFVIEPMLAVRRIVRQQYVVLQKRMIMLAARTTPVAF